MYVKNPCKGRLCLKVYNLSQKYDEIMGGNNSPFVKLVARV